MDRNVEHCSIVTLTIRFIRFKDAVANLHIISEVMVRIGFQADIYFLLRSLVRSSPAPASLSFLLPFFSCLCA
jgi:hypothetical protein